MTALWHFTLVLVALSGALGIALPGAARRCALGLCGAQLVSWGLGLESWLALLMLDLAAMAFVAWRPAGWLQTLIGGLFLAAAVKHVAFGLSNQTYYASLVAWNVGITITIMQASILLAHIGGRVGKTAWVSRPFRGRGLVRLARPADMA